MSISRYMDFDLFLSRVKAQSQKQAFHRIAEESASLCGICSEDLFHICQTCYEETGISGENGVYVFDVKSVQIKHPVMFVATFDHEIDFNAHDAKSIDILVGVMSPTSYGATHLQHLASIARLFRSKDLCTALRETTSADEMKVLFMPTQDWMIAA